MDEEEDEYGFRFWVSWWLEVREMRKKMKMGFVGQGFELVMGLGFLLGLGFGCHMAVSVKNLDGDCQRYKR